MSTEGFFGFILNGIKYVTYVQHDAHNFYDDLTKEICIILKYFKNVENIKKAFQKLKFVSENDIPTDEDIEKTKYFHDLEINSTTKYNWNYLLKKHQNSFIKILESGYVLKSGLTKEDMISKLHGYIFIWNLDENMIEYNSFDIESNEEIGFSLKSVFILLKENRFISITYEDVLNKFKKDYEISLS